MSPGESLRGVVAVTSAVTALPVVAGYEPYDVRLCRLAQSPVAALTSMDWGREVAFGPPRIARSQAVPQRPVLQIGLQPPFSFFFSSFSLLLLSFLFSVCPRVLRDASPFLAWRLLGRFVLRQRSFLSGPCVMARLSERGRGLPQDRARARAGAVGGDRRARGGGPPAARRRRSSLGGGARSGRRRAVSWRDGVEIVTLVPRRRICLGWSGGRELGRAQADCGPPKTGLAGLARSPRGLRPAAGRSGLRDYTRPGPAGRHALAAAGELSKRADQAVVVRAPPRRGRGGGRRQRDRRLPPARTR